MTRDKLASVATDTGTFTFGYEGDHISSVTDSARRTVTYSYNGDDLATSVNPDGDSLQFAYNDEHMLTSVTDFNGSVMVQNTYDEEGRVTFADYA